MPRNNRTDGPRKGRFAAATQTRPDPSAHSLSRGSAAGRGEIRIIGGEWRGRKLHFPHSPTLRPTPDRVRETLFNWLQFEIAGKRCLDLFAGSGALGFEALSRGAKEVVFVERDPVVMAAIRSGLDTLRCDRGRLDARDAFDYLSRPPTGSFDVVFLDPPYAERWLVRACEALERGGWLAPHSWIYLEDEASRGTPGVPAAWTIVRSKRAGDVGYHLARRGGPRDADEDAERRGSA
jgi:16S rRNA (guanine966-N2)-methyltransferase